MGHRQGAAVTVVEAVLAVWYKTSAHPCKYVTVCTTRALKQGLARNGGKTVPASLDQLLFLDQPGTEQRQRS